MHVSMHRGVQASDGAARKNIEEGAPLDKVHPANITGSFKGETICRALSWGTSYSCGRHLGMQVPTLFVQTA